MIRGYDEKPLIEHHFEVSGHGDLLTGTTMYFEGEDDGVGAGLKTMLNDTLEDVLEEDLWGECVAMKDDGFAIGAIPTIQLDALDSSLEGVYVGFDGGLARQLVGQQVGIMWGVDIVVG